MPAKQTNKQTHDVNKTKNFRKQMSGRFFIFCFGVLPFLALLFFLFLLLFVSAFAEEGEGWGKEEGFLSLFYFGIFLSLCP